MTVFGNPETPRPPRQQTRHPKAGAPVPASETWDSRAPPLRNQKRSRNPLIQRGQNRSIGARQLHQMAVRSLFWGFHPYGKGRNIIAVWEKCKRQFVVRLQAKQQSTRLLDCETIVRRLCANSYKSKFRDRTGQPVRTLLGCDPGIYAIMESMVEDSKRDKSIHIQQVSHGKSTSSSRTISLVSTGASGPA